MTTRIHSKWIVLVMTCGLAGLVWAEIPDPPDPVESEIVAAKTRGQWIQRFQEASDLLGARKTADALAAFESLQRDLPALDSDGMVALAIGDCQFNLKQYERAHQTYTEAAQERPTLEETIWVRLVETELAMGEFEAADARLQRIVASDAPAAQKSWAALRLGNVQETQAIRLLGEAEKAYRQATSLYDEMQGPGPKACSRGWTKTHTEDLVDAATQLQVALGQIMETNEIMPIYWTGPSQAISLPGAEVGKVRISGHIGKPDGEKEGRARQARNKDAKDPVELTVEKDGKVEVSVAGKKVDLDATTQRQILKHLQYTLRVAGQAGKEPTDGKQADHAED